MAGTSAESGAPSSGGSTVLEGGSGGEQPSGGGAGSGGTSESSGGAGQGGGGQGGTAEAGSGGEGGEPVVNLAPVGLRPVGATLTNYVIRTDPLGGTRYHDICPQDQVLIGFKYKNYSDFVNGLTAVCGQLEMRPEQGNLVQILPGATLPDRGGGAAVDGGEALCPENHVVVGFEGFLNDWIRKLTVSCASVDVINQGDDTVIVVGEPAPLPEFGKTSDPLPTAFPYTGCPAGQIARGVQMNAGFYFESLGLECAVPTLTFDRGAPCIEATDCAGKSVCQDGACKPRACTATAGCSCEQLDGKEYVFCPATAESSYSNAGVQCSDQGRRLAWSKSGIVNGWLHSTARLNGVTAGFWIGADDLTTPGTFTWVSGGGAVSFTAWHELEPAPNLHCVRVDADGSWYTTACTTPLGYACESP